MPGSSTSLMIRVLGDTSSAEGALGRLSGGFQNLGQRALGLGANLTAGISGPLLTVGALAVATGIDYQSAMNEMEVVSGATADEMSRVGDVARALGADMTLPATSAGDAAQAMTELSRAGLSVQDTMDAARGVLQLSAAAQISNADAATITANALNMFDLAGSDATHVADLLAAGANASTASITDMAYALRMSGSVAASAGVPLEDLTTAIGLMANKGIMGSDAGTSLKTMLMSLISPTDKAAGLMHLLGINIYDASGNMLPMPALISQFSGKLSGLTQEQRNAALATIFGTDAIRAANIVLMGGTDAWDAMSGAVNQGGAAADLAAAKSQGLGGAIDGLKSVIETTLLTASMPFFQSLENGVRWVATLIDQIGGLNPQLLNAGVAFAAVLAVSGPLVIAIGALALGLGALLSPIGLVIVAIAAVAAVLAGLGLYVSQHSEQIQATLGPAWEQVRTIIEGAIYWIQFIITSVLSVVRTFIQTHGDEIKAFFQAAWTQIQQIIGIALQIIQETVLPILRRIANFIDQHSDEIYRFIETAWNLIKNVISTTLGVIQGILTAILAAIRGDWSGAWDAIKGIAETVWNGIKTTIQLLANGIGQDILNFLNNVRQWFVGKWDEVKTATSTAWSTLKTNIANTLGEMVSSVSTKLSEIKQWFVGKWDEVKIATSTAWSTMKTNIANTLGEMVSSVSTKLSEIKQWFVDKWNEIRNYLSNFDLAEVGQGIIQGLIGGVRSKAQELIDAAVGIVQDAIDAAKRLLGIHSPSTVFRNIGEESMVGLGLGIETGGATAAATLENVVDALTEIAGDIPDELAQRLDVFSDLASGFTALVRGPAGDVRPVIDAWRQQIQYVIRMLSQVWQNWDDPNVLRNAQRAAEVIDAIAQPWVDLAEAIDKMARGPAAGIRTSLGRWEVVVIEVVRMMSRIAGTVGQPAADAAERMGEIISVVAQPWVDLAEAIDKMAQGPAPGIRTSLGRWEVVLIELVQTLARVATVIGQSAAAANMAEMIRNIAEALRDSMENLRDLGGVSLDDIANATRHAGVTWINGFIEGILFRLPELWDQVLNVRGMLGAIDTLTPGIALGRNWIDGIIVGIQQGLPLLEAAVAGALDRLGKPGTFVGEPGGNRSAGRPTEIVINYNGPIAVRSEADLRELAAQIGEILAGEAMLYRRMSAW